MNNPVSPSDGSIDDFSRYMAERKPALKQQYSMLLANDLSRQQWQGCFQRNVLITLEQMYNDAFGQLQRLPFDAGQHAVDKGMSALTKQVLAAFQGLVDEFLEFVVDKHRTSCALSNFPDEHKPDRDYVNEVKRDIAGLWKDFALRVNDYFLESR
jgi:hypothetical protein